jgi:hypothetical protein
MVGAIYTLLIATFFCVSGVRAQCPDPNIIPPLGVAWTGPVTVLKTMPTGCDVQITYCWRDYDNYPAYIERQYMVTSIKPIGTGCDALSPDQVIRQALAAFYNDASLVVWVDPCVPGETPTQVVSLAAATCWMLPTAGGINPIGGTYLENVFVPCWGGTAFCVKSCRACQSADGVSYRDCQYTQIGTGRCSPLSQTNIWKLDECYSFGDCPIF